VYRRAASPLARRPNVSTRRPLERFKPLHLPIALLAACLAATALAQPAPQAGNVPTVTRLVKMFSELERGLVDKIHAKDAGALDAMLDPSFEMRVGTAPGTPVARDAWIRDTRKSTAAPRIEQMAVHDFGNVAVVSFRERNLRAGAASRGRDRFVVDCWKRDGDAWKLAVRYVSDAGAPAAAPASGTLDKRY
jgi:ketosteroid isomerase-like protein